MSDQRTAKNLRLEDDEGESGTYIRLEDTGRDLADRWRLQAGETPSDWQPVEYDRPSRGGGGWILPLLIGAIVVGVAVPLLYFGVNRLLNSSITATVPGGDNVAVTAENQDDTTAGSTDNTSNSAEPAVVVQATDTPVPAAPVESTEVAAPDAEPTAVLVEEEVATINSQYGVNARLEPNTTADVLRVLEQDEEVTILDRLNDEANDIEWLKVLTSEDAEVWVSSAFVDISTRLVAEEGGEVVEVAEAAVEAPTITEPVAEGDDPVEAPAVTSVDVTISSPAGLNARVSPSADSEVVSILADGETLTAIQRSDDDLWVQVELDDGQTGWVFVQLVVPADDLSALPSTSEAEAATEEASGEESAVEEATTEEVSSTEPAVSETDENAAASDDEAAAEPEVVEDAAPEAGSSISVVVASQYGVNARSTSSTEGEVLQIVDGDTELTAIGRTEDSTWVQAPLEDGRLGWIFTEALTIVDDISTLPVVTPPAVGEPAETLPEPLAAPAEGSDGEEADDAPADTTSVETSGGITSTVPISLTVAVTATTESTTTLSAETDSVTETVSITGTEATTSTIDTSVLVTATEAITSAATVTGTAVTVDGITATVVSLIDAKARPIPSAGEESIQGVPNGVVLSAIGRSANNFWVQVELTDGTPAWVFANNVSLSADISELPEVTPEQ